MGGDPVDKKVVDMAVICPMCGAENPDSAEYCNLCLGSVGFFGSDAVAPVSEDNSVYLKKYPSSFSSDTSEQADDKVAQAPSEISPTDVGVYGQRSGYDFTLSVVLGLKRDSSGPPSESALHKKM